MGNLNARIAERTETIYVLGVDALVTPQEVVEAITAEEGVEGQIEQPMMRPTQNGNQVVVVKVPVATAKKLVEKRKIQVGLVVCRIREKIIVPRCRKCWQFGHAAGDCTSRGQGVTCFNCGAADHKATECQWNARCTGCKIDGHRYDSKACPEYRKIFEEAKKAREVHLQKTRRRRASEVPGTEGRNRKHHAQQPELNGASKRTWYGEGNLRDSNTNLLTTKPSTLRLRDGEGGKEGDGGCDHRGRQSRAFKLKILQINLNCYVRAQDLLEATVRQQQIRVMSSW
jgi:hypothetical protein